MPSTRLCFFVISGSEPTFAEQIRRRNLNQERVLAGLPFLACAVSFFDVSLVPALVHWVGGLLVFSRRPPIRTFFLLFYLILIWGE